MGSFDKLLEQIDAFIRKYYKNEMVKGLLLFGVILFGSFLITTSLEYFGKFGSGVRGVFFFGFVLVNVIVFLKYIVFPITKFFSLGRKIDRYQASKIIGKYFPNISDRLLNTLQLNDSLSHNVGNFELIRASIAQRSNSLGLVPFVTAINIQENNRKYLRFFVPVFFLVLSIAVFLPQILTQGTERVVNYSQDFKSLAPFRFVLDNQGVSVSEGEDFKVLVSFEGTQFPDKVYINSDLGKFLMIKKGKSSAFFVLKKIHSNTQFHFEGNDVSSDNYVIKVVKKATIGKLQATLFFPSYLGRDSEVVSNVGDLILPEGTLVEWSVLSKNASRVKFSINGIGQLFSSEGFRIRKKIFKNARVKIELTNVQSRAIDSVCFDVQVVQDAFPSILVQERRDSLSEGLRFFSGSISDDYGLNSLLFKYTIEEENGKIRENSMVVSKVSGTEMPFDFAVDFRRENVKVKDKIEYHFVVYDNDGVHGSKATKSQVFTYRLPSLEELNEKRAEEHEMVKESLNTILKKTQDFQKNIDRLKKELLSSKGKDFNKINQIQQLQEEQKSLQKALEKMQQEMHQSTEEKNQLSEIDKDILEKQELIEQLLEEVMDDELKDLLEKLEELMKKDNKQEINDKLDEIEMSSEDLKKQLDRSLEMLKKLQVNEKIDDLEKELLELSREQLVLKKEIEKGEKSNADGHLKQDELNDKFEKVKEKLSEIEKLNQDLLKPMDLGDFSREKKEIGDKMKGSSEELKEGKSKKAGEKQKSASEDLKAMAGKLDNKQKEANKKEQEEDINTLRSILENLITLSFDQEEVMDRFSKVKDTDPAYRKYGRKQRSIVDDSRVIKDSLEALAKRQPKIASFIDRELNAIAKEFASVVEDIDEHQRRSMGVHQQSVMTSFNNLALLLNEVLENLQSQMKGDSKGGGSCDNPGRKGKPKPGSGLNSGDMKELLKKQLESLEKGSNLGGNKPGEKPGPGMGGMSGMGSKELARMAAEQGAIRQRLEQMKKELNKDGKGSGNKLNPLINELEKQEKDLINRNFSSDLINRQKNILTRLLESEKAVLERGFEKERESKEGKNTTDGNKIRFDEYTKQKLNQVELLRAVDPLYKKYYKDKANEYFNRVN
jgi:hypothetical protein